MLYFEYIQYVEDYPFALLRSRHNPSLYQSGYRMKLIRNKLISNMNMIIPDKRIPDDNLLMRTLLAPWAHCSDTYRSNIETVRKFKSILIRNSF